MTDKKKKIHERVRDHVVSLDERMRKYRFYKEIVKDALLMLPLLGSFGGGALRWFYGMFSTYTEKSMAAANEVHAAVRESNSLFDILEVGWFLCIVAFIGVLAWRAWQLIKRLVTRR